MTRSRWCWSLLLLSCVPCVADAQRPDPPEALVIYKDGFSFKGQVSEKIGSIIYDRASGRPFALPTGEFCIDDRVRNILFSPGQVQKVVNLKPERSKEALLRFNSVFQPRDIPVHWKFDSFTKWTDKGERTVKVLGGPQGPFGMTQRIGLITPHYLRVVALMYKWETRYFTQEVGPEVTRDMLLQFYKEHKDAKDLKLSQKLVKLSTFLKEAGWYAEAESELTRCLENFPEERKVSQVLLDEIKAVRKNLYVESIEQASNVGQHELAIARLAIVENDKDFAKFASQQHRLSVLDLKAKYDKAKTDIEQAQAHLKSLPPLTRVARVWTKPCEYIADELNYDTIGRLETFLAFAQQHEADRKKGVKPNQSPEEVLALAVSGWLQGNQAAEPDPKMALKLIAARQFILDYLKTDNARSRTDLVSAFRSESDLPVDVLVRVVRMIPPSHAHDLKKMASEIATVNIDVPDGGGGSYLVKLPPDYHPLRSYPVLIVLHSQRDKAEEALLRFKDEPGKQGFILVAPQWAGKAGNNATYQYSAAEHALVTDTLRDVRRRFQVDSDRVFLFGWEEGANMAFDVGLGHPDLFAGVTAMNGTILPFTRRFYWANAQYLPFYVINGERDGTNLKALRDLLKDWSREPYACTYAEYRGRTAEWYSAEVPNMLAWMKGKKRFNPTKELGRPGTGTVLGEEFHSTRATDNRFYWLGVDALAPRCQADHTVRTWPMGYRPGTLQASLSVGNVTDKKVGAKIWNQVGLRLTGVKHATVWFTPNMLDFTKPVMLRVNGEQVGPMRDVVPNVETLLDELYQNGDRQRVFVAKLEVRL